MPYNGSIFKLRDAYHDIFKHKKFEYKQDEDYNSSKIYKISYKINLLPSLCEYMVTETDKKTTTVKPKYDFLKKANESGELGIFDTDAM